MRLKWPSAIKADNIHGIYIASLTPMTVDAIHKSIFTIIGAEASDPVKIEALKTLVSLVSQPRTIEDCNVRIG